MAFLTECKDLGTCSYRSVWDEQVRFMESVKAEKLQGRAAKNFLLFVEHPHVYTLGKSGDEANMLINLIQLQAKQAEFVKVDHPILDLEQFRLGVKDYVDRLEEVVIRTIAAWGIRGERLAGATGVWLDAHQPAARKICAIGIKCSRFVTMHGFALNVNTDLNYFNYINPCGFVDKGVTSMARERGHAVTMDEVKATVRQQFQELFGMEWV